MKVDFRNLNFNELLWKIIETKKEFTTWTYLNKLILSSFVADMRRELISFWINITISLILLQTKKSCFFLRVRHYLFIILKDSAFLFNHNSLQLSSILKMLLWSFEISGEYIFIWLGGEGEEDCYYSRNWCTLWVIDLHFQHFKKCYVLEYGFKMHP